MRKVAMCLAGGAVAAVAALAAAPPANALVVRTALFLSAGTRPGHVVVDTTNINLGHLLGDPAIACRG